MDLKFLVVDNSITARNLTIVLLKNLGYKNFIEASNGEEALSKLINDNEINFIITDWNMPSVSGLDLTKTIRGNEKLCKLPVLMVSFRGKEEDIARAFDAKVDDYIIKPFTAQALKEKITAILTNLNL